MVFQFLLAGYPAFFLCDFYLAENPVIAVPARILK